jgi:hypothetical protein
MRQPFVGLALIFTFVQMSTQPRLDNADESAAELVVVSSADEDDVDDGGMVAASVYDDNAILFYGQKHEFGMFSNFHQAPITIDGTRYDTTEVS